ncbi:MULTISPECIES: 16S rRNA (cytosine(967)-C(5))-methyltransferase RsmB [unclassified Methylophaga]|uniref:16S rRNA (cytosine(967)-C(5))-methyltransferase RsmB n=1 Tax=unclassified Methylophaga TaxID=2629249 RepID=UPI000C5435CA|nr:MULTISPECIES: 16S rRNA (cytosine(967)-C(5))-methyltransferase RsmB [unclassified Methylophaga]MAL50214.1 16S rRNA (cytosine(967)-C(5))-methyltransferase [Methylophaga sp.]MBP25566.1 16S rRNA (cytosine(967)-C(5))-methyltransferase [Methylophaga sp.]
MAKSNLLCPRSAAALVIQRVIQGQSLNTAFVDISKRLDETQRPLFQQLTYGVIRWFFALESILQQLLSKPLKTKDADVQALLLVGIYQLRSLRIPDHAALSETVNASKRLNKQWASGLINACLRNYQRQQKTLEETLAEQTVTEYAHPAWLIEKYQADWPDLWQDILSANNQQPPMMLRVNSREYSQSEYLELLEKATIPGIAIENCPQGILLQQACDVFALPGFVEGAVSVQDGAAQQVVDLLDLQPNQRILDACSAPGGKTCHILERFPNNEVIAVDISQERLKQVEENLSRLNLSANCLAADASNPQNWWNGEQFDRILIDAPCTGSGVIRRHPDIKLLRKAEDIEQLVRQQQALLDNLWPLLKPDGLLIYTTCSALKQENELQIEAFLQRQPEAMEQLPSRAPARRVSFGYQLLPGDNHLDGFYYACLRHR